MIKLRARGACVALISFGVINISLIPQAQGSSNYRQVSFQQVSSAPSSDVIDDERAPTGWKRYQFQYGGGDVFSIVLPKAPQESVESTPLAPTGMVTTHTFTSASEKSIYVASYIEDLPVEVQRSPVAKQKFLESLWNGYTAAIGRAMMDKGLAELKVKLLARRNRVVSGRQAQEQDFTIGNTFGRGRAVLAGRYVYMVMTLSPDAELTSERASFLKLFEIHPKR